MKHKIKIIDADSHVIEPPEMWARYLAPEFAALAPTRDMKILGAEITAPMSTQIRVRGNEQMKQAHPDAYLRRYDAESHLKNMARTGIDLAFIYPTYGLWLWADDRMDPLIAGAFTSAYNRWLLDEFCSFDPDRLRGVGAVNLHAPANLPEDARQIAARGGSAVFIRPNPIKGRLLSDPAYEPFWAACEALGLAIGVHEGTHSLLPTTGADRFQSRFALHACSHPMEQMMALLSLIEGGVLERHPKLRVAFLESGCTWLPYWLWRLDEEHRNLHWEVSHNVRALPSEYFRRQCFIAMDPSEPGLAQCIRDIGPNCVIFGSDYPHMDHQPDIVGKALALADQVGEETLRAILWDNPRRLYGVP